MDTLQLLQHAMQLGLDQQICRAIREGIASTDDRRFRAACAALTGLLMNPHENIGVTREDFAAEAVRQGNALVDAFDALDAPAGEVAP